MAQIKKSDLLEEGLINDLKAFEEALVGIREGLQKAAQETKANAAATQASEEVVRKLADSVLALENAYKATINMQQQNAGALKEVTAAYKERTQAQKEEWELMRQEREEVRKANEERRKTVGYMGKLTEAEKKNVLQLKEQLETLKQNTNEKIKAIELEKKSYNELYATYNTLKDALNRMTTEERLNTVAGKSMTEQSAKLMDVMNKLQISTGKFSLNVGNYRSAFDGLGYSIQQVIREVPSAINLNQFFLAISNNIPMVIDQIKLFKREQEGIKKNLSELQEGTKEYIALQGKQMGVWTKIIKSVLNWQTLLIAGLLILRNYEKVFSAIKNWWEKLTGRVLTHTNAMKAAAAVMKTIVDAQEDISKDTVELKLITTEIKTIERGTKAWEDAIDRVNEITKSNLDATSATVAEIDKATKAYIRQARQIAINNKVVEQLAKYDVDRLKKQSVLGSRTPSLLSGMIGDDKEREKFQKNAEAYEKAMRNFTARKRELDEFLNNSEKLASANSGGLIGRELEGLEVLYNDAEKAAIKAEKTWKEYVNTIFDTGSKAEYDALEAMYRGIGQKSDKRGGRSQKEKLAEYESMWKEYMQARSKLIEDAYKRERQAELDARVIEVNEDRQTYEEKLANLKEYARQNNWSVEQLKAEEQALYDQWYTMNEAKEAEHQENLRKIWEKYDIIRVKDEIAATDVVLEQTARRIRTRAAEAAKNETLDRNIIKLRQKLIELEAIETKGVEENEKNKQKAIVETEQAIDKLAKSFSFSQQLKVAENIFDVFGVSDRLQDTLGSNKRGLMESILGFDMSNVDKDVIASAFEEWFDSAEEVLKSWYNTTKGYIDDAIDAYVALYEAKAALAEEDTENAKEAYEREKALMEAGYASRIDAAWAEYQEKKRIQEQAEADAKKAAEVQKSLDTATQAMSLVTAIANLYKVLSGLNIPFPGAGVALATTLAGTMIAAFTTAKVKAAQAAKYGEGGFEMVAEGGTHAGGHDTALGVRNRRGRSMVVERGEGIGVFSRRAVGRYGNRRLEGLVRAVNSGQLSGDAIADMGRDAALSMKVLAIGGGVKLDKIEKSLTNIEKQGESRFGVDGNGNMVERRGNAKITYLK